MKKRKILITLIIFSVLSLIFILFTINKNKNKNTNNTDILNNSNLQSSYNGEFNINFSVSKENFTFPTELPKVIATQSNFVLTQVVATNIANNLGFLGEPTILDDELEGTCYFWKGENKILFAFAKGGKIRYSTGSFQKSLNKSLSDLEISSLASDFITNNGILEQNSFNIGGVKYLTNIINGEGFQETNRSNATLFRVSVFPGNIDYQFVTPSSVKPSSYIDFYQDGSVYSFQLTPLFIKNGEKLFKLLNYEEVVSSINKATLIELNGETHLLSDLPNGTIKNIDITDIKIGYLVDSSNQSSYNPVYILSGSAFINDAQHLYFATLYLPAIKED